MLMPLDEPLAQFLERPPRLASALRRATASGTRRERDLRGRAARARPPASGRDVIPPVGVFLDAARCAIDRGDLTRARASC